MLWHPNKQPGPLAHLETTRLLFPCEQCLVFLYWETPESQSDELDSDSSACIFPAETHANGFFLTLHMAAAAAHFHITKTARLPVFTTIPQLKFVGQVLKLRLLSLLGNYCSTESMKIMFSAHYLTSLLSGKHHILLPVEGELIWCLGSTGNEKWFNKHTAFPLLVYSWISKTKRMSLVFLDVCPKPSLLS